MAISNDNPGLVLKMEGKSSLLIWVFDIVFNFVVKVFFNVVFDVVFKLVKQQVQTTMLFLERREIELQRLIVDDWGRCIMFIDLESGYFDRFLSLPKERHVGIVDDHQTSSCPRYGTDSRAMFYPEVCPTCAERTQDQAIQSEDDEYEENETHVEMVHQDDLFLPAIRIAKLWKSQEVIIMTAVERELLYKHMMAMDQFESKLILHEHTDTSVGRSDTQVFLNCLAAPSQANEMIRMVANEADDAELDQTTAKAQETGVEVKGRMSLSAPAPAYESVCQALALDLHNPLLFMLSQMN
ncbi:hypothetical protein Aspvir_006573 [Aspergillus viridinutans]|uniref:Uncharacterized protein n=1 Tax=Aspergillus viridinutans TaxID=75553 RepID=A0A9P3F261_ASPVI|nr:uncharacterized protein Aspvir_006573 [Aspergillus viridinutans]GIK02517.1 hypothetical protein Aspvir_006573 [Aspergillus viridinutans]